MRNSRCGAMGCDVVLVLPPVSWLRRGLAEPDTGVGLAADVPGRAYFGRPLAREPGGGWAGRGRDVAMAIEETKVSCHRAGAAVGVFQTQHRAARSGRRRPRPGPIAAGHTAAAGDGRGGRHGRGDHGVQRIASYWPVSVGLEVVQPPPPWLEQLEPLDHRPQSARRNPSAVGLAAHGLGPLAMAVLLPARSTSSWAALIPRK